MDCKLWYREHIANTATKGLQAAMALRRLCMMSPRVARQLVNATVALVIDYASNVWMHTIKGNAMASLNRVQRIAAQAITGTFSTVATAVAEAEASICTVHERHTERATKLWVYLHTLPKTNPLARLHTTVFLKFTSPLQKIAQAHQSVPVDRMEVIEPYAVTPWGERISIVIDPDRKRAVEAANNMLGVRIATSASARNGIVGLGLAVHDTIGNVLDGAPVSFIAAVGPRTEQNPYTAELAAMAMAMRVIPPYLLRRQVTIYTSSQAAMQAASQPRQQSGQASLKQIYAATQVLREGSNSVLIVWAPSEGDFELGRRAKAAARQATEQEELPQGLSSQAKSTTINTARTERQKDRKLPEGIGTYSKQLDTALPGNHTRVIYDKLTRQEANVLAQLRTGMARLNGYLHRIGAVESGQCACGQAEETVAHFLFRCTRWETQQAQLIEQTQTRRGNLSFYLGGKRPSDTEQWTPNMNAIYATVNFAIATGRLDVKGGENTNLSQPK
jgi:ribonuclease HI